MVPHCPVVMTCSHAQGQGQNESSVHGAMSLLLNDPSAREAALSLGKACTAYLHKGVLASMVHAKAILLWG